MPATRISGPGLSKGGPRGVRGLKGDKPAYEIDGLRIRWEQPDGTLGDWIDLDDVVGFTFQGDWSSAAAYETNDLVNFGESVYNARRASTNARPDLSPTDWRLLVRGGTVGDGAVTPAKLAAKAATEPKLGDGAASTLVIADGAVTNAKIPAAGSSLSLDATKLAFRSGRVGAVATALSTLARRFIHISEFGTVGDGSTDDRAALQAGLNAAAAENGVLLLDAKNSRRSMRLSCRLQRLGVHGR